MRVIIAYDISDDSRRAAVSRRLLSWGIRLQESVFECVIGDDLLETTQAQLGAMIDESCDRLHVIPLCDSCSSRDQTLGQRVVNVLDEGFWLVDDIP